MHGEGHIKVLLCSEGDRDSGFINCLVKAKEITDEM
jgi:hypothetical protein